MRPLPFLCILAICSPLLHAGASRTIRWNDLCKATNGNELTLRTANGETIDGYCLSVDVSEIAVTTKDRGVVRLGRATLSRIQMSISKKHQLLALHRGVHRSLRTSLGMLFSPAAPLGIVAVPGTLAWGAVAAPFCALHDLADQVVEKQEIAVI